MVFRALRHRNYRLFFIGQGLSLVGTWLQQTGEVWLAYRLTHSAWALGIVGLASQLPTFLLAVFAGTWVDRSNKHRLVLLAQTLEMLQALILGFLVLSGRITYPLLIVVATLGGIFDALEIPSRQSFVIDMVDNPRDLPNAIALNSSLVNVARLIGPASAGLLIAAVGEGWCFVINGLSYLAVIVSLLSMRMKRTATRAHHPAVWRSAWEGLTYALSSVPMETLLGTLALFSFLASSYSVLIPIFAAQVLHGGAHTLGYLMAASGFGAMIAALLLASRATVLGLGRIIGRGMILFGTALIVFSLSRWFWLSWTMMVLAGFGMMSSTASINTLLQTIVEPDKRGRIMSFFTTAFIGMAPIGNFTGGWVAHHLGAPLSVRIAGFLCCALAAFYLVLLPILREHIRPIYRQLRILPEVASGLQTASTTIKPRG